LEEVNIEQFISPAVERCMYDIYKDSTFARICERFPYSLLLHTINQFTPDDKPMIPPTNEYIPNEVAYRLIYKLFPEKI